MAGHNTKPPKWMVDQMGNPEDFFNVCKHKSYHYIGSVRACVDCGKHLAFGEHESDTENEPSRPPSPKAPR